MLSTMPEMQLPQPNESNNCVKFLHRKVARFIYLVLAIFFHLWRRSKSEDGDAEDAGMNPGSSHEANYREEDPWFHTHNTKKEWLVPSREHCGMYIGFNEFFAKTMLEKNSIWILAENLLFLWRTLSKLAFFKSYFCYVTCAKHMYIWWIALPLHNVLERK